MDEQKDHLDFAIKQVFARIKNLNSEPTQCPDEELLAAYLEGSLHKDETESIEGHLMICSQCTETLISFSQAQSTSPIADEGVASEVMIAQAKSLVKPSETRTLWERVSRWFFAVRPMPALAAASVVLGLVFLGIYNFYAGHIFSSQLPAPVKFALIAQIPPEIVLRGTTPDYMEVEIKNGEALNSGNMFKIKFELQQTAYIYLLYLDSRGNLTRLLPDKDSRFPVKLKPHKTHTFPQGKKWLRLDNNTGKETFYLLVSSKAIKDIDRRIDQLQTSGIDKIDKIFFGVRIQAFMLKHE